MRRGKCDKDQSAVQEEGDYMVIGQITAYGKKEFISNLGPRFLIFSSIKASAYLGAGFPSRW
jgi:arginine/ornithine N-succinyltransferase beta subunit